MGRSRRTRKLQVSVDDETVERLEKSMTFHNDASLAECVRRAIALTSFLDDMRKRGYEILVRKGDDVKEIVTLP